MSAMHGKLSWEMRCAHENLGGFVYESRGSRDLLLQHQMEAFGAYIRSASIILNEHCKNSGMSGPGGLSKDFMQAIYLP